ncbi:MAG: T9SS type A sorting domain-containing protein [Bacteroidetes bacterium]|nr:T9SS type A sorting domain-containing protein [Bacteroidota bacterium]
MYISKRNKYEFLLKADLSAASHFIRIRAVLLLLYAALCTAQASASDITRVLFVGNSYTYVNDLPTLFSNLSLSGGRFVVTGMSAPGGYMLENHMTNETTLNLIKQGGWDFVVLQEQSQAPTIEHYRYNSMYPSAVFLDSLIRINNLHTCFFMTWGRQNGGQQCIDSFCSPVFTDFFHMQDSLKSAYTEISSRLNAVLCSAGEAWRRARTLQPGIDLWDSDESHPSLKGSYLVACVFYAKLFNASPVGLNYTGGLIPADALFLQQCAAQTVIGIGNFGKNVKGFSLEQNYPNPFNASTKIIYSINKGGDVILSVYDVSGRIVLRRLASHTYAGRNEFILNMENFSSGVYFYTLSSGNEHVTKRMLLVK